MELLVTVLGLGCGGLAVVAIVGYGALYVLGTHLEKKARRVIEQGEHTTAWLVQANSALFDEGSMDMPALVLISADKGTAGDAELMTELTGRIMELKGVDPAAGGEVCSLPDWEELTSGRLGATPPGLSARAETNDGGPKCKDRHHLCSGGCASLFRVPPPPRKLRWSDLFLTRSWSRRRSWTRAICRRLPGFPP